MNKQQDKKKTTSLWDIVEKMIGFVLCNLYSCFINIPKQSMDSKCGLFDCTDYSLYFKCVMVFLLE